MKTTIVHKYQSLSRSGRVMDFTDPDPGQVDLGDIATGLAHVCRFSGQMDAFYSVAQHSLHVASHLPLHLKVWGLLHDATEAYMGDVPRPVKLLCPDYKVIEARVEEAVRLRFGLDPLTEAQRVLLKEADSRCLMTEARDLKVGVETDWKDVPFEPYPETLYSLSPKQARQAFLTACRLLGVS
jgi:5'-deoxynucleotidase YfbR-like HD superfamily hydrolase